MPFVWSRETGYPGCWRCRTNRRCARGFDIWKEESASLRASDSRGSMLAAGPAS
jgi:hypothetical protein